MATIQTAIQLRDGFSTPLRHMTNALNITLSAMTRVQSASHNAIDTASIQSARNELAQAEASFNRVEEEIRQANTQQQNLNNSMRNGTSSANGLLNIVRQIGGAYLGIQGIQKVIGASDMMASNKARLNLIVDDGGSVRELENKIFESAQRSRAVYTDVAQTISKLGLTAGRAFNNNDEIIAFTELMNKNFVIGGADTAAKQAAMYQLTQAMQSGRLQGDEFRSIIENAPLLANSIEDYMRNVQGAKGSMKEWASEGLLTADVIKNAMFMSADEVNSRFKSMPMTWGQVWAGVCNEVLMVSQPLLSVISLMAQNWSILGPIIYGVVTILGLYLLVTKGAALAQTVFTATQTFLSIGFGILTGNTAAASMAMFTYNSALLACPITWVIMGIIMLIAVVYAGVAAFNKLAGTSYSATGIIAGCFMWAGALILNIIMGVMNYIASQGIELYNLMISFGNFFANFLKHPIAASAKLMADFIDFCAGKIQSLARMMDTVFGTNTADYISGFRNKVNGFIDSKINVKMQSVGKKLDPRDYQMKRINLGSAYSSGYNWGKNFKLGGAKDNMPKIDTSKLGGASLPNSAVKDLGKTATGTGQTAANTAKMAKVLDATGDDIKYLRDVAEREVINRFTTAEVKVEMKNQNNINSNMDLDGVVDYLGNTLNEKLQVVADGTYT